MPWLCTYGNDWLSRYPSGKQQFHGDIVEAAVLGYHVRKQAFELKVAGKAHYFVTGSDHLHNFLCVNLQQKVWLWIDADKTICYTECEL